MASSLRLVTVAPKGMGLYDFVALQEGFFAAEGLNVDLDWKTFRGTQSSWKDLNYFQRPQDRPYTLRTHVENLTHWIEALDLRDITFVLQDWGGGMGVQFTVRHPERVARLFLANTIAGYGAAAKATTIVNFCGLGPSLRHVVDTTPYKQGRYLPGTGLRTGSPDAEAVDPSDTPPTVAADYLRTLTRAWR